MHFKIIINCGPCEEYIEKCLESVLQQSVTDWEAYVTIDPCEDETFSRTSLVTDPRIHVKKNDTRLYSLVNQIDAIKLSGTDPEDVIVSLDGDDWFSGPDSLQVIADTYKEFDCWMTYGSWVSNVERLGKWNGSWPAYPEGTTDFRHYPLWLATAVRTWKRWLWCCVKDFDLRDEHGKYFRVCEDRAIMFPLLEMAGTARAKHIAQPIMVYNQLTNESVRNITLLGTRKVYEVKVQK